jgi:hypothetical protein
MLQMFHLFQSSVAASVFMLQVFYLNVTYVFTYMLQVYILDVSSVLDVSCIKCFILHVFDAVPRVRSAGEGW